MMTIPYFVLYDLILSKQHEPNTQSRTVISQDRAVLPDATPLRAGNSGDVREHFMRTCACAPLVALCASRARLSPDCSTGVLVDRDRVSLRLGQQSMMHFSTPHGYSTRAYSTSHMVAEQADLSVHNIPQSTSNANRKPSLVTEQPVLPRWRPHDGRNDSFIKWFDALETIENDRDIELDEEQPSFQHLATHYPPMDSAQHQYLYDMSTQASEHWQADSNLLFDVIKASLILDGPHLERDLRKIASFIQGKNKDYRSLRSWALSFADLSSIDSESDHSENQTARHEAQCRLELQRARDALPGLLVCVVTRSWQHD